MVVHMQNYLADIIFLAIQYQPVFFTLYETNLKGSIYHHFIIITEIKLFVISSHTERFLITLPVTFRSFFPFINFVITRKTLQSGGVKYPDIIFHLGKIVAMSRD